MMIEHVCLACEMKYSPQMENGVATLSTFKGYTVDFRLQQFRKVSEEPSIAFIDFPSDEGQALLIQMHESVVTERVTEKV